MKRNLVIILSIFISVLSCKTPEARKPISVSSGSFIKESVARNKALYKEETETIKAIIAKNPEHNYQSSGNGFWYFISTKIENDTNQKASFGDVIIYDYDVKDLNGNFIYTKEELKTQRYAMEQQELFTGLREGLKLMHAGETATFIFPSQTAYGYYGDENKIGTNIPIICEVSVHSITKKE